MPVTLSGMWEDGTGAAVANGTLFLTLSQAAVLIGTTQVAPSVIPILLDSTGKISSSAPTIFGNDVLSPAGTVYFAKVVNANGQTVWQPQQGISIGGSSFNFNNALPTSAGVILANAVLQNPTGPQSITGFGLTLSASAPLTVNGTTTLNGGGSFVGSFGGPTTFTGTLTSTNLAAGNVANKPATSDAIQYVSPNGNATNDGKSPGSAVWGVDIGAAVNTAYANLPTTGGVIYILNTQGCQPFTTAILLNTVNKFASVIGENGAVSCLSWNSLSGTAMTVDPGGITVGSPLRLQGFQLTTVNNSSSQLSTGLSIGQVNGCTFCLADSVLINGFKNGLVDGTFDFQFFHSNIDSCSAASGSIAFQTTSGTQIADDTKLTGGRLQGCATLLKTGNGNPIWLSEVQLVQSNQTSLIIDNSTVVGEVRCSQCHFFVNSTNAANFFSNAGNLSIINGTLEDGNTTGSRTALATQTAGQLTMVGNEFSSGGETATQLVNVTGGNVTIGFNINFNPGMVPSWITPSYGGFVTEFGAISGRTFNTGLVTKSSNYTLGQNDGWVNVTGTTTITVPHALVGSRWVVFNSGAGTVTIQADSGNVNGAANITIAANVGKEISCDGTNCFAR